MHRDHPIADIDAAVAVDRFSFAMRARRAGDALVVHAIAEGGATA